MTTVTPTVEFYDAVDSSWRDITADCIPDTLKWSGGIRGSGPTDRVAVPGQLDVEINNSQGNSAATLGYYSPNHASCRDGWTLGAKIRVKLVSGANTRYWLYRIKDIRPVPGQYRERRVEVVASDYIEEFSKRKVNGLDIQHDRRGDELLTLLTASLPFAPVVTDFDTGAFTMPYAFHDERDEETYCMTVLQKIAQSDLSYIYLDGDSTGGETLHYESHKTRQANVAAVGSFSDTMTDLDLIYSQDNIWNRVKVTVSPVETDTQISVLGEITEEFPLEASESRTLFLRYIDSDTAQRISGAGLIPPVADTDYRMSSFFHSGGNELNADLSFTAVAGANSLLASISNTGSSKGYVSILQIRGYKVTSYDKLECEESDSTSITAYGEKTITYNMPYQSSAAIGTAFAKELLRRHKNPRSHVTGVTFIANSSTTLMGYALTHGIGTRETITETVTGIGSDFFINGYEYELQAGDILQVTWNLEPAFNVTQYWILGDAIYSVLGSTTILAPL